MADVPAGPVTVTSTVPVPGGLVATSIVGPTAVMKVAAALPKWNTYAEPAQEALFDMAFNLGLGGLKKFPHMLRAVDAGDWATAAAQCHREGISEERNRATAALFLQAGASPGAGAAQTS